MSKLGAVVEAVEKHGSFVLEQVKRRGVMKKFAQVVTERWDKVQSGNPDCKSADRIAFTTPRVTRDRRPGEIARYLFWRWLAG